MIPLRCFALFWRGVKCCGFVEFWHELGEKTQKKWKFAKKLVENAKFFLSSTDFPSLMFKYFSSILFLLDTLPLNLDSFHQVCRNFQNFQCFFNRLPARSRWHPQFLIP
jgi:hypothetical protein